VRAVFWQRGEGIRAWWRGRWIRLGMDEVVGEGERDGEKRATVRVRGRSEGKQQEGEARGRSKRTKRERIRWREMHVDVQNEKIFAY